MKKKAVAPKRYATKKSNEKVAKARPVKTKPLMEVTIDDVLPNGVQLEGGPMRGRRGMMKGRAAQRGAVRKKK